MILKVKDYGERKFTSILNDTLQDRRLSATAIGVIAYCLSMPHDWKLTSTELAKRFGCDEATIRAVMKELLLAGYARPDGEAAR